MLDSLKGNWTKTDEPVQPYKPTKCQTLSLRMSAQLRNSEKSGLDSFPLTELANKQALVESMTDDESQA